ncbi:flagellar type III secretion system protein FlhB [Rhodobacter sp. Har01]|uniref:EscU/YscU/HrcU family type III secretion system export apparatus switch protein n=1 Tax=Rhodobacter sp. Har01 TaxID=2883999 RepID=UPI001D06524B|nr:flagellar type III secretion system protein FlhB [Rhodobacter sp. Har01]MCB6177940.1 flagellar type III secretion system protein FlhB [Rhodobacter sp. Har01]
MDGRDDDEADKEFDPSQRKLDQAREQGDVARSEDLQAAVAYGGFLLAALALGPWAVSVSGTAGMVLLEGLAPRSSEDGSTIARVASQAVAMAAPFLLLLVAPASLVVAYLVATRSLVFAPSKLALNPARLSILANFRQKFNRAAWVDFARKTAKLIVVALILGLYLQAELPRLNLASALGAGQVAALVAEETLRFLTVILAISLAFGAADFLWQRFEFARRNRMSRKELTDEMKDSEGDPHLKADRRRRAQEVATRRMLTDVPKADVVIVNPSHYAVALKWERGKGRAPVCVAKGVDEIAARIRERAQEAGVPIRRDPPTARVLHATLEIGQEVRPEHYAAVAAAIRFAEAMRKRARKRMGR